MPRVLWCILTVFAELVLLTTALRPNLKEDIHIHINKDNYPRHQGNSGEDYSELKSTPVEEYYEPESTSGENFPEPEGTLGEDDPGQERTSKGNYLQRDESSRRNYFELESTPEVHYPRQQNSPGERYSGPETTPGERYPGLQSASKGHNHRHERVLTEHSSELKNAPTSRYPKVKRAMKEEYYDDVDSSDEDLDEDEEYSEEKSIERYQQARARRAFGKNDYLLPENFRSLRRKDIPVTYRLHDDLLRYYRKGTRPVTHPNKIVHVQMTTFLYQIIKLYWQDEFLQWQPDAYQGATEIFLSSSDIWIPEFSLYYSLNFNDAVKLLSNNDVRVNYTGHVRYYLPFSTESLCKLDVKFFPFDIQQCTLLFGSWAHSNDSVKYSLYSKNLSLIDFYDSQEWQLDLQHSHIMSDGFLYDYLDPPLFWEMIIIDLVVIRQSFYYVFNLVIPSTIITLVAVIGFHTPSTSGRMRDAKFRLGIMSLMSTSVILLAIVEVMPKFSMSSTRRGRGSFSGIPLIGLYYFILLAIIGLSTVTTSMFVFLERDLREKHKIPWFLRWLAFDIQPKEFRRQTYRRGRGESTSDALLTNPGHQHLNGFVGDGSESSSAKKMKNYAQSMALSLMKLTPGQGRQNNQNNQGDINPESYAPIPQDNPAFENASPRQNIRRRLSLATYDNMLVYQYFNQLLEDAMSTVQKIETGVQGIKNDIAAMGQDDQYRKWQRVIRRLEILSLMFYVSLLFTTMFLFFNHSWYCSIGASVCGQQNLKCPWMPSNPNDPSCQT